MQMIGADYGFDGTSCRSVSVHSGAIMQAPRQGLSWLNGLDGLHHVQALKGFAPRSPRRAHPI